MSRTQKKQEVKEAKTKLTPTIEIFEKAKNAKTKLTATIETQEEREPKLN